MKPVKKLNLALLLLTTLCLVTACSQGPSLEERVDQVMQAKMNNTWSGVYECLNQGYKEKITLEQFVRGSKLLMDSYTIDSIEMGEDKKSAVVKLKSNVTIQGFDVKDLPETQNWIKEDGNWVMVLDPAKTGIF